MKRGLLLWLVRALLVAMAIALLSGCDEAGADDGGSSSGSGSMVGTGETGTGSLTYQGETTTLEQLYFVDWGEYSDGVYNIDVYLLSPTLDWDQETGTGRLVYLEMFFSSPQVTAGTYAYTDAFDPLAGSFSDFSEVTTVTSAAEENDYFSAGSVEVAISGSTYTITGSGQTGAGEVSFQYSGPLTGVDDGLQYQSAK